nr:immunoglobulin heavy chain junction region [Mus musculus]
CARGGLLQADYW